MKVTNLSKRTQELLSRSEGVAANAIAEAAKKLKEQQEKEEQERALAILAKADGILTQRVNTLRAIRAQETAAKEAVDKFDAALEQFMKDGDVNKLAKDGGITVFSLTGSY